jgi:hypothetical protein
MTDSGADANGAYPVTTTARALIWASTLVLPHGEVRERYRLEHYGELSALAAPDQSRYAVGALCTAWATRRAVTRGRIRPVSGGRMKYLFAILAISIGIAAVVAGEADDSPGLQGLGVLLDCSAVVLGVRVARRSN